MESRRGIGDIDGRAPGQVCTSPLSSLQHSSVRSILGGLLGQVPRPYRGGQSVRPGQGPGLSAHVIAIELSHRIVQEEYTL